MDATDRATISEQDSLRAKKSLATLVMERQAHWETTTQRTNFMNRVKDIIKYCRDDLDMYADTNPASGKAHEQQSSQYTSRPMTDLEDAADAFCGNLFVPSGWFSYEIMDPRIQKDNDIQSWLQRVEDYMGNAIFGSGFYAQGPNIAMDALSIGDGLMFVGENEREDKPFCHYWEALTTWFIRDMWGNIIAVHHRWTLSASEAYERWGTKCSNNLIQAATSNRPAATFNFIQAIYRRNDTVLGGLKFGKERPLLEVWVEEGSEKNEYNYRPGDGGNPKMNGILEQGGYMTMPVIDWPYWWKSSETYGRGPMHLVSIKRLHAMWKTAMLGAERQAGPPMIAPKALLNNIDQNPDGITWINRDQEGKVTPLYGQSIRIEPMETLIDRAEVELKDMLKLTAFLAMTLKTKDMRVEEVATVIGEKAALLSPRLGLMACLFLDNFHARIWDIEEQRGRMAQTEPPGIINNYMEAMRYEASRKGRKFRGMPIRVIYKGPLQIAMDSYFVQRRIAAGLAPIMAYLLPIDQEEVADRLDVGGVVEEVLDKTGSLQALLRPEKEYKARKEGRLKAQNALVQAQTAREGAGAVKDAAAAAQTLGQAQ